jgi:hypothetical protein
MLGKFVNIALQILTHLFSLFSRDLTQLNRFFPCKVDGVFQGWYCLVFGDIKGMSHSFHHPIVGLIQPLFGV